MESVIRTLVLTTSQYLPINVMKKSNIFAYVELSKLVEELKHAGSSEKLKEKLKAQSAYFNIIEPRYFSENLVSEWEGILYLTKQKGARTDEEGKVITNAIYNTIESFNNTECQKLVDKLYSLYDKVQSEFS